MPSDPKEPIEEMLEASAKARRAAFGKEPVMPNPMRAQLHDEISRASRERDEAAPRTSWLLMFWPRVAVAAALATILVVGPMMWWRGSESRSLGVAQVDSRAPMAVNEAQEAIGRVDETFAKGPAAAGAAAPNVSLADNDRAALAPEQTPAVVSDSIDQSKIVTESEKLAATGSGQITKGLVTKEDNQTRVQSNTANSQPAAPPVGAIASAKDENAAPSSAARAIQPSAIRVHPQFTEQSAAQAFQNRAPTNRPANILNNFQVQQQGTEIRIVDSDGSTYSGVFESATETRSRALVKARQSYAARAESGDKAVPPPQSRFRASGYNVTLKKSVVVEADYSSSGTPEESKKAQTRESQNAARITGTARVSGEAPVQIDATAVRQ